MHKFPDGIQTILGAVSHCAKHNNVKVFLRGNLALYAATGDAELIQQQNIDIVLSYESGFGTNKLYNCLIEHITINREVENSPLKYHFISDQYEIKIDLIAEFDPTLISHVQRFGRFSVELVFLDLASEKIKHLSDIDPSVLHNINKPVSWVFEDVLGFVELKGNFPNLEIPKDEYDHLKTISLGTLKESIDIGWSQQVQKILLTRRSGAALRFMSSVFVDGKTWSFKALVDYVISLNVGINEEANIETVFTDKKFELIDLYNEFFLDGKKTRENPEEVHHRLNTTLKLIFDSPNLDIPRPYINTHSIQAMAECGPDDKGVGSGTGHCDVFAERDGLRDKVGCNPTVSPFCCANFVTALEESNPNSPFTFSTQWVDDPSCLSSDAEISSVLPPDFCPYGECFACTPSACEPQHCCCCTSIDLVRDIRARCYDRVYFSCNQAGTAPEEGADEFPAGCPQCFEACDFALEEDGHLCEHISGHGGVPSPPTWWGFEGSGIGPCKCDCEELSNPSDPSSDCGLTCVKCKGLKCNAHVAVTAGNCNYQFNITPGTGCCGTPGLVDAIFVIDVSGSMRVAIDNVKDNVSQLTTNLAATGAVARFGLLVFGGGFAEVEQPPRFTPNSTRIVHFPNGEILTDDVTVFETELNAITVGGGGEAEFEATEIALATYPWEGIENILFLIGNDPPPFDEIDEGELPLADVLGDPESQPTPAVLIPFANDQGVTIYTVQPTPEFDFRRVDLATGTGGSFLSLSDNFATVLDSIGLNVFGSSCKCLDTTPIPALFCPGGIGPPPDNECLGETTDIPIQKCVNEDNSDCNCNEPLTFDICGEMVVVQPDANTLNLVCCGDIEGGGCSCPTTLTPEEGCCGVCGIDVCADFGEAGLQAAIDAIWCECRDRAVSPAPDDAGFFLVDERCTDCVVPDENSPEFPNHDAIVGCVIRVSDGMGGFVDKTRAEVVAEVTAAWRACDEITEPPPPAIDEASCFPNCDRTDECIVGDLTTSSDDADIRVERAAICATAAARKTSVRNPATAILNNGIGLVAYESMTDTSVIQIDQFNTSLPAKILPNRRTNYGRLQHELKWQATVDNPIIDSSVKLAKLYYFEDIASHFFNGVSGIPTDSSIKDTIVFQTGPLQNQCFSLDISPIGPVSPEEDEIGNFIRFTVPIGYSLSSPFPSLDDVYDIEWFIIDRDDMGLTGSVGDIADTATPGFDFLLGAPVTGEMRVPGANKVNTLLQLEPHVHDGIAVPIANPSLSVAHNYMNATENSHFVYLAYQALEDSKWNIYLRQLRLSEYSKEKQIDSAVAAEDPDLADPSVSFTPLAELGVDELTYRVICTNDDCSLFGDDFIAKRSVTLEVTLPDGREVFNKSFLDSTESWPICPGLPSETSTKKKVFSEMVHSAIVNKCPDQFEFNDIFYNWDVGDEFSVPFTELTSNDLFVLLRKPNDSSIQISESTQVVSGITITSSQVGAVWYDEALNAWGALNTEFFQDLLKYKGIDLSAPIPLTDFELGHCTHPIVKVNSNNEVYVVYECTDPQIHQIHITGTAVPTSSFPLGIFQPKNIDTQLNYFLAPDDFVYRADITTAQRLNQLPDVHIDDNDVIHVTWQSNRDNYWEIYYANSDESFSNKRITDFKSKSLKPSISGNERGDIYITWHDDRFGNWEILMAYRDDERPLTLLEQDPYMAVVRNEGYKHFSDVLTFVMDNTTNDVLCLSDLSVRFFNDRLLSQAAFEVVLSEFPIAFSLPGLIGDTVSNTQEYAALIDYQSSGTVSVIDGVSVSVWSRLLSGDESFLDQFIDTGLPGSHFDTIQITFDNAQPQFIRLVSIDADTGMISDAQQSNWFDVRSVSSGQTVNIRDLTSFTFSSTVVNEPSGRYKRIIFAMPVGQDFAGSGGGVSEFTIVSINKNRICIAPGNTVSATLDLTPSIRVDKLGNETIETPLPIEARKNVVYFTSVTGVQGDGTPIIFADQKRSTSCETCSLTTEPWESSSCTFSFEFENIGADILFFNARIRFYADQKKLDLVAQFDAFNDGQLECFTTDDNRQAQSVWQATGYEVFAGNKRTITLWPLLADTTGLLCGIKYWVQIEVCSGTSDEPCIRTDLTNVDLTSWTCNCSSPRWSEQFGDAPLNIREIIKWNSSGDGFADTRLTETGLVNNYNPQIHLRSDLTGLVLFETDRDGADNVHSIYATAFRVFPTSNMYASGAEAITSFGNILVQSDIPIAPCLGTNCDDCSSDDPACTALEGRNVAFSLDQYDNIFLALEQQNDQAVDEMFETDKQQSVLVHRCGVHSKNLAFIPEELASTGTLACDALEIVGKAAPISQDKTFKQIIRMARVSNKSAKYHITRLKKPAAVVDKCDILIEIVAEPDVVSVRLKNENDTFSTWYPFDPEIGEYTMVVPWVLSPSSGAKAVTVEAATYQGLSASFSITIIADYKGIDHTVEFFILDNKIDGASVTPPTSPAPGVLSNKELKDHLLGVGEPPVVEADVFPRRTLSLLEGIPVAGMRKPTVTVDGAGEAGPIVNLLSEFVYIEIAVAQSYLDTILNDDRTTIDDVKLPTFDVLQQGSEDSFSVPTIFIDGKFRGVFQIKKDDETFFRDGLSFIIPHFFNDCSSLSVQATAEANYIRDKFNVPVPEGTVIPGASPQAVDRWAAERNEIGEILSKITIRGSEDPYFVFGDPNYRLKKRDE